ncbi:MAG: Ig-like domain-containing protein [Lysobacterales bacterium]
MNATASDKHIGVTSVEFLIDNVSRGTDSTSPYSLAFNSTTLSNGTHSLVVKAAGRGRQHRHLDRGQLLGEQHGVDHLYRDGIQRHGRDRQWGRPLVHGDRGTMGNTTDKDFFAISLNANETLRVDMSGGPSGSDY